MQDFRAAFLGFGNMAFSIAKPILKNASDNNISQIYCVCESEKSAAQKAIEIKKLNISGCEIFNFSIEKDHASNKLAAQNADIIFLGTKPNKIASVLQNIKDVIKPSATIISMAAGVKISQISSVLQKNSDIIRIMPNLAVETGKGVIGLSCESNIDPNALRGVLKLLKPLGFIYKTDENNLNLITALCGSFPAFLYYFLICAGEAGHKIAGGKISQNDITHLILHTFYGSAAFAEKALSQSVSIEKTASCKSTLAQDIEAHNPLRLIDLIKNISSKGGTTEAGLKELGLDLSSTNSPYNPKDEAILNAKDLNKNCDRHGFGTQAAQAFLDTENEFYNMILKCLKAAKNRADKLS